MPKLKHATTGITVDVSDATAKRLGAEWGSAEKVERTSEPGPSWKVAELKEYAEANGVDLDEATKKEDIIAAINAAKNPE